MTPVILVPGTYAYEGRRSDYLQWWSPGADFWCTGERHGLRFLGRNDPFVWTSDLGGLFSRPWTDWKAGGEALRWYGQLKVLQAALSTGAPPPDPQAVSLVAHSHGGQVAAYAAARAVRGFKVDVLVTLGMPVRADMMPIYVAARQRVRRWVAVSAAWDGWKFLGAWGTQGRLPDTVEQIAAPSGVDHEGLHSVRLWTDRGWWAWLYPRAV